MGPSVVAFDGLEEASGLVRLHHGHRRPPLSEQLPVIARHGSRERAHAGLHEHVRGLADALPRQLLLDFGHQGGVALHHPARNIFVARPRGVRDDLPTIGGGIPGDGPHGVVVGSRDHLHLRVVFLDRLDAGFGRSLVDVHNAAETQFHRRPRHAPAVVAVGGRREADVAELGAHLFGLQLGHRQFPVADAQPLAEKLVDGEGAAQHFEGIQAQALGLVLDPDAAHAQQGGQARQAFQRAHVVAVELAVQLPGDSRDARRQQSFQGAAGFGLARAPVFDPFQWQFGGMCIHDFSFTWEPNRIFGHARIYSSQIRSRRAARTV